MCVQAYQNEDKGVHESIRPSQSFSVLCIPPSCAFPKYAACLSSVFIIPVGKYSVRSNFCLDRKHMRLFIPSDVSECHNKCQIKVLQKEDFQLVLYQVSQFPWFCWQDYLLLDFSSYNFYERGNSQPCGAGLASSMLNR